MKALGDGIEREVGAEAEGARTLQC
jgi:hypothetical protein